MKKYCVTIIKDTYNLIAGLIVTFKEMFKPVITVRYPWQQVDNVSSFRSYIELVPDVETGKPICVACGKCAAICPSGCIHIESSLPAQPLPEILGWPPTLGFKEKVYPPKDLKQYPKVFTLDFTLCSLCGQCVEICPVGAIRFSTNYNLAGYHREDGKFDLLSLLGEQE